MPPYNFGMSQHIDVTVAAVAERDGAFLLIEEHSSGRVVLNQPAGHLEPGESLIEAAVRETLEEAACGFEPEFLLGTYVWRSPADATTFVRFAFTGRVGDPDLTKPLDDGIIGRRWLDHAALLAQPTPLRSPMVLRCIEDYLAGTRYPLNTITHWDLADPRATLQGLPTVAVNTTG